MARRSRVRPPWAGATSARCATALEWLSEVGRSVAGPLLSPRALSVSTLSSCLSGLQYAVRRETKYQMSASVAADAFLYLYIRSIRRTNVSAWVTTTRRTWLTHPDHERRKKARQQVR